MFARLIAGVLAKRLGVLGARRRRVLMERDLAVPAGDGVVLLADRHYPSGSPCAPVILIRTPYGRRRAFELLAWTFVQRGYQVLIQSTRGTRDSGGRFEPFLHETADGAATVSWLRQQSWFPGVFATWGVSYLGYTQWALAGADCPEWTAAVILDGLSDPYSHYAYPGGAFALGSTLWWTARNHPMSGPKPWYRAVLARLRAARKLPVAEASLPLRYSDRIAAGGDADYFQLWLDNEVRSEYWDTADVQRFVPRMPVPVYLQAGWHDPFLSDVIDNYRTLREKRQQLRLIIGPWNHGGGLARGDVMRESFDWLDTHVQDRTGAVPRKPVRVFVMGTERWADFAQWPPEHTAMRWYLGPSGTLVQHPPGESLPDRYRYDPSDPTPSVGGSRLGEAKPTADNRALEARPDVLTYTTPILDRTMLITGPVSADLYFRSTVEHTDFFARLCDVHPDGRSMNICDGITRQRGDHLPSGDAGEIRKITVDLGHTAHEFRPGHRIRLQISSGAHPRFARNTGTGEPLATARDLRVADQEIFHDADRCSALVLPLTVS